MAQRKSCTSRMLHRTTTHCMWLGDAWQRRREQHGSRSSFLAHSFLLSSLSSTQASRAPTCICTFSTDWTHKDSALAMGLPYLTKCCHAHTQWLGWCTASSTSDPDPIQLKGNRMAAASQLWCEIQVRAPSTKPVPHSWAPTEQAAQPTIKSLLLIITQTESASARFQISSWLCSNE